MIDAYAIVGYDKDNDVYEVIDDGYILSIEAEFEAKRLASLLNKGELRRENGEPFDWIEVHYEYGEDDPEATMVWASWDCADCVCE